MTKAKTVSKADLVDRVADETQMKKRDVKTVIDACAAVGVPCQGHTVEALHPWEAIIDHAQTAGCDLLGESAAV